MGKGEVLLEVVDMRSARRVAVANRKWIPMLVSLAMTAVFAGCGGGSSSTTIQNPPPPATTKVSIAFNPAPAGSVFINGTTTLTAVVSNDSSNSGVDWLLPCPSGATCGQLSPLHTESGKAVTYTPPPTLAGNSQTVNIIAFATSDHNQNVLTPITVKGFAGSFHGTYVLQSFGIDLDPITGAFGPSQFVAAIVLDGNGIVSSVEQTYSNSSRSVSNSITGGTYYLQPDGRGTLTLKTGNQNLGQNGVEFFSLAFLSTSHALIAKIDDPSNMQFVSNESSAGTMDLQTGKAAPLGGYAFAVNGSDTALNSMAVGVVLKIDSPRTISGSGSVADQNLAGGVTPKAAVSGTVSDPDTFGAVKFNLTTDFGSMQFMGYIVDTLHIKLVESDNGSGSGFGSMGGTAISQGAATGTFVGKAAFSGTYVFGILGEDLSLIPSSLGSVGVFTADGAGKLTNGYDDEFLDGLSTQISDSFKGHYSVDPQGTGRVDSSVNYHSNGPGPELIFYLTGNGNPPLILDADVNIGSLGAGIAYPASPQVSFSGKYGLNFTQSNFGSEDDGTGPIIADGTAEILSGILDTNAVFAPVFDTSLTGTFQTSQTGPPNRLTGMMSSQLFPTDLSMAYYMVDPDHGFFVENDSVQMSFGYFARRNPVCPTCP
jgi:hypothetical protein